MDNVKIMTGNEAAAVGVKLVAPHVIAAYPITPQTKLAEMLAEYVENGVLASEYVRVESEHSSLTVCIAASAVGARVFTATSSNGLLYMHEQLHWAAGSRVPVVMCCVNRGVGAPWSIFNDQQDSFSQRDTGWIQLYCRNNQEIIDTVIQAYRIAEQVYVPVMVCYDGFILSHTKMPVAIPAEEEVSRYLPPLTPVRPLVPEDPITINPVFFPWRRDNAEGVSCDGYMDMRLKLAKAINDARETIREADREFGECFNRTYGGLVWDYRNGDAAITLVSMGSLASEATVAVDMLREKGVPAGVVALRSYRPFPKDELRALLGGKSAIIVFEKCMSYGNGGGFSSEIKTALYGMPDVPPCHNVIAGLGGRNVTPSEIADAVMSARGAIDDGHFEETYWLGCDTD